MENVVSSNKEEAKNIVQENEVTKFENINESFKENKQNYKTIKSPMVGTFYLKSLPTAEPFVRVGDKVKKGDVLCIIEAMKLMNEIESDVDGEIAEICYKDEELVEYGSVLFKIK
jgi:acetyl-CoA carboxylase biotin carboxyl carrier protein